MSANSEIEWTDHTFNPWWGCIEVSPACANCYARQIAIHYGLPYVWGKDAPRRLFDEKHWDEPRVWNRQAQREGERRRVFCASMADVFEGRTDLDLEREKLWKLIAETPSLDWLLLTKRPENIGKMAPWGQTWPANVWLGTTVENQKYADLRIPHLLQHPAVVRFLSVEPLLGPTNLIPSLGITPGVDWVITGGESGQRARPMDLVSLRGIRDQCVATNTAFFLKQWGQWAPEDLGKNVAADGTPLVRMASKKKTGRMLDGRTWEQFPTPRPSAFAVTGPSSPKATTRDRDAEPCDVDIIDELFDLATALDELALRVHRVSGRADVRDVIVGAAPVRARLEEIAAEAGAMRDELSESLAVAVAHKLVASDGGPRHTG